MTYRATVLTAVMDSYDSLKPVYPQDGADVNWVCFTDSMQLLNESELVVGRDKGGQYESGMYHPTGWEIRHYDRPVDVHPNRAAKRPKVNPAAYTTAPASVWLDASFRVVSPRFVADTVATAEAGLGIAQFGHPWRDSLYAEAEASIELPKYLSEILTLRQQVEGYRNAGMPDHWGLWATGLIARVHRPEVLRWGRIWGAEIARNSFQDQVSHPYALWKCNLRPENLPGTHFANDHVVYEGSGRH